ncbi:DEAD/DEAH box helicase [Vagococcus silagei]|uniref:DEAD/DEAH box helicase n=1 Tax=Vagococcus silagei TaxID=2508885 RepID=A0A4S3B661_9ENTE|nr:DEAD/DEAH box helicase [Vagococcus silagei]THB61193.1 DEAD/DEAH box helicase [Vagococcus silagei]
MDNNFRHFSIDESIIKALNVLGYTQPTEVQKRVIPLLLDDKDVIVKSQTGSGKTAAFGIPVCERVEWEERAPQVLVLTPTRELALQIKEELFNIGRYKRLKVEAIFGKSSFQAQEKNLKQRTHIVVATPGRLFDHIERGTINLTKIDTVIIDEADEMFTMGFIDQLDRILKMLPRERTQALFSATMPDAIQKFTKKFLKMPELIEIENQDTKKKRITQEYVYSENKMKALEQFLILENPDSSIIFCNTKLMVDDVNHALKKMGADARALHGGMEQRDRSRVIQDFKRGYFRHLVATDVAARGLDVSAIALVINFDSPDSPETYTHRIGRTARFTNTGHAISLVNDFDQENFEAILAQEKAHLKKRVLPSVSEVAAVQQAFGLKQSQKPEVKKEQGFDFKEEIMKIHINAGKKQKMRAGDIVGALCQIDGMSATDIGVIQLLDISTFVEILNHKGPEVLKALQTLPIKGRLRNVNQANETRYEQDIRRQNRP